MTSPLGSVRGCGASHPRNSPLTLFARQGCHLCDELAQELRRLGIAFDTVDVDQDRDLVRRYGEAVPVLFRGTVEIGRAPFKRETLSEVVGAAASSEAIEEQPKSKR